MLANVNGAEIYYERVGQGRPLLVMHGGLGLDHTYFRPYLDPLADDVELIYYDHRDNGRSSRSTDISAVSHATWADDAEALRQYLGLGRMVLLGHSYGGFLAQEYALKYGDHLDGLILSNTVAVVDYMPTIQANAAARGGPEQLVALGEAFGRPMNDAEDFRDMWRRLSPLYFHDYRPDLGEQMDAGAVYSAEAWNHVNAHLLPVFNTLDQLAQISAPTLALAGGDDWIMPLEQVQRLTDALPNAEVVVFQHSGHFPFIEETDAYLTAVRAWLTQIRAA
ncbi:MAG: alpha/beta fold hydrolase [Anaerolineae bacterium]|nr:alpha/beta fold hydrolase [Anaerolineae bacterium]